MTVPEVRYPVFWLGGLMLAAVMSWAVWPLTEPWRTAARSRWERVIQGPPVPSSAEPQRLTDAIVRRGLLLRDGVVATDRPDGAPIETIGRRLFVAVYDQWPLSGPPTHYRIGNRRPFGWVPAAVFLPWSTRLVMTPDGQGRPARPVLAWEADRVRVAVWDPDEPWSRVGRLETVPVGQAGTPGVLLSRSELLALLERLLSDEPAGSIRVRALLGLLSDRAPLPATALTAAPSALPPWGLAAGTGDRAEVSVRLARRNERWAPETAWAGIEFMTVPLTDLP